MQVEGKRGRKKKKKGERKEEILYYHFSLMLAASLRPLGSEGRKGKGKKGGSIVTRMYVDIIVPAPSSTTGLRALP